MKKIIVSIIVLLAVGGITYYVVFKDLPSENPGGYVYDTNLDTYENKEQVQATTENDTTPKTEPTTTEQPQADVVVKIRGFAYNPKVINIKAGTKVTWVNEDSVSHTVTSDSGGLLNSGLIPPGGSFSFTFSNSGSESYYCVPHPMMKGSVVITE